LCPAGPTFDSCDLLIATLAAAVALVVNRRLPV
jgi:hypothetical protein